jgi:Tol biopolymer transport system component
MNIYSRAADGTGADELVLETDAVQYVQGVTPDGTQLLVQQDGPNGFDIVAVDLAPPHGTHTLLATKSAEHSPSLSPDGRWVVYNSDMEGQWEVYVAPFPDMESRPRWKISSGGGDQPLWSRKGDEIFFRGPTGSMLAAQVTFTPTFVPGKVIELFPNPSRAEYRLGNSRKNDVSPFNGRFLLWKATDDASGHRVVVVLNALE